MEKEASLNTSLTSLNSSLKIPLKIVDIGKVRVEKPFVLAPMAGVNCTAFRLLSKESGAGLIFTQMYHCDFITHKYDNEGADAVYDFVNLQEEEKPVAIQLVGSNPERMVIAAKLFEKKADIIDINLGCPDDNMIKSFSGGYYSLHPEKIDDLIKPVIEAVKIPVTAKIRIGYDSQHINGVSVAQQLEKLGVSAITIHGRVTIQKYAGKANWEIIKHIKNKLSIPVIGNGDINNSAAAVDMLAKTRCDLAMIGRRTIGDPGIFTRCNNKFYHQAEPIIEPKELFFRFIKYYRRYDLDKSFTELRTHALWFAKRAKLGPKARSEIAQMKNIDDIVRFFE
jgi:nifR3 family TIM-barrel protein